VELDLDRDADVDRESRDALVRLTRDSVIVAARNRGARVLSVQLLGGGHVTLRVIDDGQHGDGSGPSSSGTLALQALRERAEALGATITTSPAAGSGTMVEVVLS
jgi:signal transduction histidine kinase